MTMKKFSIGVLCLILLADYSAPNNLSDDDIISLLDEYERQSEALKQYQAAQKETGIHLVKIENPSAPLDQQLVSVNLESADLPTVLQHMDINYSLLDLNSVAGHVTAKFSGLPMQRALELLLSQAHLMANIIGELVTISRLPVIELEPKPGTNFVFKKQEMHFADTRTLEPILRVLLASSGDGDDYYYEDEDSGDDFYDEDSGEDYYDEEDSSEDYYYDEYSSSSGSSKSLRFAAIHSENAILVMGPSGEVNNALKILRALDTDGGHVLIEALVLEFSAEHLMEIGTRISDGASGRFSDVSIDWASIVGETIAFTTLAGAANTRTFRAAINMLVQHNFARVIARPYLATGSGHQARIEVVEDRYVTTFRGDSDEVTLEPVTSGIRLRIKPFVLPGEQIWLDLIISASQFIPSLQNVSLTRTRSDATSTIRIGAGQTLVIGGLMSEQSSTSDAGVPGLRESKVLGFLFGQKKSTSMRKRLLIYITLYIWEPGMETPVDSRSKLESFMEAQEGF